MRWGIKQQVLLLALVPTLCISILLGTYFISTRLQDLEDSFRQQGETMAIRIASAAEYGVYTRNKPLLQNMAITLLEEMGAESISFYTKTGQELSATGKNSFTFTLPTNTESLLTKIHFLENDHSMAFVVPITSYKKEGDGTHLDHTQIKVLTGWMKLELETKSVHLRQYQILLHSGLIFLLALSISSFHAFQMGRNVTRPILELAQAVEKIKEGKLSTRIKISAYREMEILESGINTMAQTLENAHNELQNKVEQATLSLRRSLETIEVQNIELEIARRTAENANKIKSEFLADMSHEIRTPLNGVVGFIHLLQKTTLNPKQQEYLTTIHKSSNNLLAIINDILDFSKIEAGKLRIDRNIMDIRDCIDESLNLLAPYAHEKGITLIPLIYSDVPSQVLGDPLRVKQIITNLVNNSIKFTDKGSVIIRVMLEQETYSHLTIRVNVTDTGIGLAPEEQRVLFQAFNQTKTNMTGKFGGTGLGLVICKKLVEQMGGNIGVESELQKGATFWFTFQVEKYIEDPLKDPTPLTVALNNPNLDTALKDSLNILAVDDNHDNLRLITILLEDMGMKVTAAKSGEEAVQAVEQQSFHLILMDIRMPNMNGIEASHEIRKRESTYHRKPTPIIALTAHAMLNEKQALLAAGIDDYLAKPIGESELKDMIHKWIHPSKQLSAVDWEFSKKLAGGRLDLAKEFFQKLVASLPEEKTRINKDFLEQNWTALRDDVHKLHGACCYCGVPELKKCTQRLETAIANHSIETIKPLLDAFNKAINAVIDEAEHVVFK